MKISKIATLAAAAVLAAMSSTWLHAQTASHEFPNLDGGFNVTPPAADASESVNAALQGVITFRDNTRISGLYNVPDCITGMCTDSGVAQSGATVAAGVANVLCVAADTVAGWECGTCPAANPATDMNISCTKAGNGIVISKPPNSVRIAVMPNQGNPRIDSFFCYTATVGNPHEADLLDHVLLQVVPNGVIGPVGFRVFHHAGGQTPAEFAVNTGSFTTSEALHAAIETQLESLGLGLIVEHHPPEKAILYSGDPADFSQGWFVAIVNAGQKLTQVGINGVPGQSTLVATSEESGGLSTMSEWGAILLIGLLLASGVWLLRRTPLGS